MKLKTLLGILLYTASAHGASPVVELSVEQQTAFTQQVVELEHRNFEAWKLYHSDMEAYQRQVDELQTMVQILKENNDELIRRPFDIDALNQQITDLEKQNNELWAKYYDDTEQLQLEIDDLKLLMEQESFTQTKEDPESVKRNVSLLEHRDDEPWEKYYECTAAGDVRVTDLLAANNEIIQRSHQIDALRQQNEDLIEENKALWESFNTGEEKHTDQNIDLLNANNEIIQRSHQIQELRHLNADLREENDAVWSTYHTEIETNQRKTEDLMAQIEELKRLLDEEKATVLFLSNNNK